jgi:Zn-dependent protease with chaperone function
MFIYMYAVRAPWFYGVLALGVAGCSSADDSATAGSAAVTAASVAPPPVRTEADLRAVLEDVRRDATPELEGYTLEVSSNDSDRDFFHTTVDPFTAVLDAKNRTYRIVYSTRIFADRDPMSRPALRAVLTHELGHMHHYTTLDSISLASFAVWYATSNDISAYEHTTDEFALQRGKALGLKDFRTWLYAHVAPEALAAKQHDYYTPEEIDRYRAAHPEIADRP